MILTVIGGSSVGTPVLLKKLSLAVSAGKLPETHVRLFGRNRLRLERIQTYFNQWNGTTGLTVSIHRNLKSALTGATHVLCQIRPGGMELRAQAERTSLDAGIPGDEGLGPSGLAVFLIGRPAMQEVIEQCAQYAPNAIFLQMSSPLGLFVALAYAALPKQVYGICELPCITAHKVLEFIQSRTGLANLTYSLAGLNHQSWLYNFRDSENINRTNEILNAIDDPDLVDIEPDMIRRMEAIPVPYLKLFIHRDRELTRQLGQLNTRGEQLTSWVNELDHAYCNGLQPDFNQVSTLLGCRDMGWYEHGVIPALQNFIAREDQTFPLNLPNDGAIQGVDEMAIVEVQCQVGNGMAKPIKTAALPEKPAQLTEKLVTYEKTVSELPDKPTIRQLKDVLVLHPMVSQKSLNSLSKQMRALVINPAVKHRSL